MNVLVTGAKGMLGTDVVTALNSDGHNVTAFGRAELDICDLDTVLKRVSELKPHIVINCAAYVKVDLAETNVKNAYKVNAIGARNLAVACNKNKSALMHISTDYIFNGEAGRPYIECDFPDPLNVYGKSKWAGEEDVRNLLNEHYIIRTQWLFGKTGSNFVKTMLKLAETNSVLTIVDDQFGSPTYTKDLSIAICQIIKTCAYGTYHVTNSGIASWYELAKYTLEYAGRKDIEVKPRAPGEYAGPAKRPKYSPLDNFNLKLCGFDELRDFRDALREYLEEIGAIRK